MKNISWNWGTGIFALYTGFALIIVFMVYKSMHQRCDLLYDNYYERELKYEEQMHKEARAGNTQLQVKNENKMLQLNFSSTRNIKGEIHLIRPSDAREDIHVPVDVNSEGRQMLPLSGLKKGLWKLTADWKAGSETYYYEENILIP